MAALVAPAIALIGLLTYSILIAGYSEFYGLLGVGLNEVSLNYANVLAESVGIVAIITVTALVLFMVTNRAMLNVPFGEPTAVPIVFFGSCLLLICLALAVYLQTNADQAAFAAINGRPVKQLRAGPIVFFSIRLFCRD